MPKVTAPMLSESARGHLGGVLTAYRHTGRAYIIEKRKRRGLFFPHKAGYGCTEYGASFYGFSPGRYVSRGSERQDVQRESFAQVWVAYALLTTEQKALLSDEARTLQMTGANLFMSRWLKSRPA